MRRALLPILLMAACVVRTGGGPEGLAPAEPQPPPADFEEVEARLDALLDAPVDVDQRDRLLGARSLARRMKTAPPDVQQDVLRYLRQVVSIEERARPIEVPAPDENEPMSAFSPMVSPIVEEEIEDFDRSEATVETAPHEQVSGPEKPSSVEPQSASPASEPPAAELPLAEPPEPAPPEPAPLEAEAPEAASPADPSAAERPAAEAPQPSSADPIASARASLDAGRPAAALAALEPCRDELCWEDAAPLWAEARDAYVGIERERAGALWRAAGRETDPANRAEVLRETRAILAALVDRFPDTVHASDIRRNIEQVQADLGAIEVFEDDPGESTPPAPGDPATEAE